MQVLLLLLLLQVQWWQVLLLLLLAWPVEVPWQGQAVASSVQHLQASAGAWRQTTASEAALLQVQVQGRQQQ